MNDRLGEAMPKSGGLAESSAVYMIDPRELRASGVELLQRSRDKAYGSHKEHKHLSQEERGRIYDDLKAKIEAEGFRRDMPITIQLLRKNGNDKILQGHHRLSIAIDLNLPTVPVRFVW